MTHFTCQQPVLDRALTMVNHALTRGPMLPILANVLIAVTNEAVTLSATNLEIGISLKVEAEIIEAGAITLPAKLLQEYIRSLPADIVEIQIASDSQTAQITSLRSSATIKGLDAAEFPALPSCEEVLPLPLKSALFKEMVSQVAFAAANDDSRPALSGVLLQLREAQVTLAAADAFRLAVRHAALEQTLEQEPVDLLIPGKTMVALARILPNEGEVHLHVSAHRNQILFQAPGLAMVSRLIEGTFPPYSRIIPPGYATRAVLNRAEFAAAVKSAALFARDNAHITQITLNAPESELGNGTVRIEASAEDLGDGVSMLDASVVGPEIKILFSSRYLSEAINALNTEEIAIELTTPAQPGVLKPVGTDTPEQIYVVMPMFLKREGVAL